MIVIQQVPKQADTENQHFRLLTGLPRGPHLRPSIHDFPGREQHELDGDGDGVAEPGFDGGLPMSVYSQRAVAQHGSGGRRERQ